MFMVCMIHINYVAHAYSIIPGKELFFYLSTWTESVGYIGVNLYAIITGYVCLNSKWRLSRYIELWMQVAFYTIGILAFGLLLSHFGVLPWDISWKSVWKILLQLPCGSSYWYFSAYSALFFIMPFLNKILVQLKQREYILLLGSLLVLILCANILNRHTLYAGGYNVTWLTVLYVTGAYFQRFSPKVSPLLAGSIAFSCTLQPLLCSVLHLPGYLSYCSPVMVLYSLLFFLLMYKFCIEKEWARRLIMWAAPLSFGVYLIHVHPWTWFMLNRYTPQLNVQLDYPWWLSIGGGVGLYVICTLLDWVRCKIFEFCRVKFIADRASITLEYVVNRVMKSIRKI